MHLQFIEGALDEYPSDFYLFNRIKPKSHFKKNGKVFSMNSRNSNELEEYGGGYSQKFNPSKELRRKMSFSSKIGWTHKRHLISFFHYLHDTLDTLTICVFRIDSNLEI